MLNAFGDRQKELLRCLLKKREGLTVDELVAGLKITRTAVNQHLTALERDGFVQKGEFHRTGGRPGRVYLLSAEGIDLFPKQYAWFSARLLEAVRKTQGPGGVTAVLREIANRIVGEHSSRLVGKDREEQLGEVLRIMNELGCDARIRTPGAASPVIEVANCVYHHLAVEHPEVCRFDVEILSKLTDASVEQQECIVRGGNACRFKLTRKPKSSR